MAPRRCWAGSSRNAGSSRLPVSTSRDAARGTLERANFAYDRRAALGLPGGKDAQQVTAGEFLRTAAQWRRCGRCVTAPASGTATSARSSRGAARPAAAKIIVRSRGCARHAPRDRLDRRVRLSRRPKRSRCSSPISSASCTSTGFGCAVPAARAPRRDNGRPVPTWLSNCICLSSTLACTGGPSIPRRAASKGN